MTLFLLPAGAGPQAAYPPQPHTSLSLPQPAHLVPGPKETASFLDSSPANFLPLRRSLRIHTALTPQFGGAPNTSLPLSLLSATGVPTVCPQPCHRPPVLDAQSLRETPGYAGIRPTGATSTPHLTSVLQHPAGLGVFESTWICIISLLPHSEQFAETKMSLAPLIQARFGLAA